MFNVFDVMTNNQCMESYGGGYDILHTIQQITAMKLPFQIRKSEAYFNQVSKKFSLISITLL